MWERSVVIARSETECANGDGKLHSFLCSGYGGLAVWCAFRILLLVVFSGRAFHTRNRA